MHRPAAGLVLAGLATTALVAWWCAPGPPRPLAVEAYVWQRRDSPELRDAVERSRTLVSRLHFLGSEISRDAAGLRVARTGMPSHRLRGQGAVLRLGASLAKEEWTGTSLEHVATETAWLAATGVVEVQLDFDCPQGRLGAYRDLLESLRPHCAKARLTITALPAWLGETEAASLFAACDGVVLQVHSLHLPARPEQPVVLCDPAAAHAAVARMAKFRRPFRVALNSYGCEVLFDSAGKVVEVVSEDTGSPVPASAARRAPVISDADALAALVAGWKHHPPPGLEGIIWYRLPLDSDRRNWRWATLAKVARGEAPRADLRCLARLSPEGAWDIVLENRGERDEMLPEFIDAGCDPLVLEGLNGYAADTSTRLRLGHAPWPWLPPGASLAAGWLRTPDPAQTPRPAVVAPP